MCYNTHNFNEFPCISYKFTCLQTPQLRIICVNEMRMIIGYYADIANECQVFHICQPVTYADGETETFHWAMICPEQTVFDQVRVTMIS